ncbi:uncharacterized protein NECHADRAFT_51893 [Fusarium vanettenii 77-13-4]|uniref:Uncharacterized protein n=1 Tax=Fusarium vanettenii (strain ATCC MYA-4622 / CBS 123669 / FGSC 9596 / NRRL 45880 / 77-13-4) TaxID=660122 RepID=C7ZHB8_FUSV7|nr:uncharacterized protein NECHADRAFT_51893 [Fusarium vanettenii 77-13-4]EEU36746.1 hypothetical protein NECHADRAFT_51893 [Fusarium vanettenii 77-13-4]
MPLQLTFLNTSDAPGLGAVETKQMRAHITKTNFARRRQRLAKERQQKKVQEIHERDLIARPEKPMSGNEATPQAPTAPPLDPGSEMLLSTRSRDPNNSISYLLYEFRPIVFPAGYGYPGSERETVWVDQLLAEPALIEASMAIGLKYTPRHRTPWTSREADIRKCMAISMINKRLDTAAGLSDGMLGAVFTLAFAERLASDEKALEVHIQGLAQMIRLRRAAGITRVPSCDSIGQAVTSTNGSHEKLMQALRNEDNPTSMDVSRITSGISQLRKALDEFSVTKIPSKSEILNIEHQVDCLKLEVEVVLGSDDQYIRTLRFALQLFLLLSWLSRPETDFGLLAEDLRHSLAKPQIRLCSSVEPTIWQFFVGAVAAEKSMETRNWYINRLQAVFDAMQVTKWTEVVQLLDRTFMPDMGLLERFKLVWQEIGMGQGRH